jgi:hypothetical protein
MMSGLLLGMVLYIIIIISSSSSSSSWHFWSLLLIRA